jgi:uncharacterized protein YgiM (DUF1202 family)
MNSLIKQSLSGLCGLAITASAIAATGDIYRVSSAKVNLRNGPSDTNSVLTTVKRDTELLELRRDGSWLGVRVMTTGEEGWIYDNLVEKQKQSRLQSPIPALTFKDISPDFDQLIGRIGSYLGYPIVSGLEQPEAGTLRITASPDWLLRKSTDAHLMAATMFYQMWRDNQEGRPVKLILSDNQGDDYIVVADSDDGPQLTVNNSSMLISDIKQ